MISSLKLSITNGVLFGNYVLYRSLVGALQYVTLFKPDISSSVNKVSHMSKPMDTHLNANKKN